MLSLYLYFYLTATYDLVYLVEFIRFCSLLLEAIITRKVIESPDLLQEGSMFGSFVSDCL